MLKKDSKGMDVINWQHFLLGQELYFGEVDNDFGNLTEKATKAFQKKYGLVADGIVGKKTLERAYSLGLENKSKISNKLFPSKPNFPALTNSQKEQLFGHIEWEATPTSKNKEKVTITNNFIKENIVLFEVPQLAKATNGKYKRMRFHKLCKYQMLQMWKEWEEEGLLHLILTYGGTFIARLIRGSKTHLSNHSYGTAMDINMEWNRIGHIPAKNDEIGSVLKLVAIANKWGFYWGGHFNHRKDGMHFEVAKIINE